MDIVMITFITVVLVVAEVPLLYLYFSYKLLRSSVSMSNLLSTIGYSEFVNCMQIALATN